MSLDALHLESDPGDTSVCSEGRRHSWVPLLTLPGHFSEYVYGVIYSLAFQLWSLQFPQVIVTSLKLN